MTFQSVLELLKLTELRSVPSKTAALHSLLQAGVAAGRADQGLGPSV